jgi:ATP-dependent Clp protease adaptor protein ClpS
MELIKDYKLILINDDVNNYDYVIACLIRFCKHDIIQAEQCALITDKVGKCHITSGSMDDMFTTMTTLQELGLKIELVIP